METMNEISGYFSPSSDIDTEHSPTNDSSDEDVYDRIKANAKNKETSQVKTASMNAAPQVSKRFDFIPMRLTETERKLLLVLENALEVCEYTDVVDVTFSHTRKSKLSRILESLVDVLSISCGLLVSSYICI